jgi:hypothetical protein
MRVRPVNPRNDATTGAGCKPYPQRDSILGKAAGERELTGDLADTSKAELGRRDLTISRPKKRPGSNSEPGSGEWNLLS